MTSEYKLIHGLFFMELYTIINTSFSNLPQYSSTTALTPYLFLSASQLLKTLIAIITLPSVLLQVENTEKVDKEVTIRIFMAPKLNERGVRMNFMEQRLLWAEMDRFKHTCESSHKMMD